MIVADQLKNIDNKIKANAYSSGDLMKYEYLTGEDLRYQASIFEQAKFDYYPLGNIFTKGLDEYDQKEGIFKRLENIKDKNEEMLNVFSAVNKVSKAAKNQSDYNYDNIFDFYRFYRDLSLRKVTTL